MKNDKIIVLLIINRISTCIMWLHIKMAKWKTSKCEQSANQKSVHENERTSKEQMKGLRKQPDKSILINFTGDN